MLNRQLKMRGKIAFINCRTYLGGSGLVTMPFAFNAVIKLQQEWNIDLFLGEEPNEEYKCQLNADVKVRYISKALQRAAYLNDLALIRACLTSHGYSAVFGIGQVGVSIAYLLARLNGCPLIVFNDEFPSCFPQSRWNRREKRALRRAEIICVPDINRVATLQNEIGAISSKTFIETLNVPLQSHADIPELDWNARLDLPPRKKALLCAGGMGDHNQIPELMSSVPSWPEDYVLILRGNNPTSGAMYRDNLRHLDWPGRINWHFDLLSPGELDSLFQFSLASIALYRWQGANMIEMGKASGKILRSIALGVPVIATNFPSLSFIETSGSGVLVNHPSEIAPAIQKIEASRDDFRARCLEYGRRYLSFDSCWTVFEDVFEKTLKSIPNISVHRTVENAQSLSLD
jgi:glycosyltransferase involved in cell wall biosynthesis